MNKTSLAWAACLVFSLVTGLPAQAQSAYPSAPAAYTQQQLDQMLAPVALYPDSLLAQVLMAATYPLEVVQAQRFVEARPGLQGDGLARAVAPMPWDPSVKALVQFPSVLAMMNDRLDWMQQLGQAFLSQQGPVMDTVQNLRERARIAGTLESSPQQRVMVEDNDVIVIEPVNPQVVYVPYYNPVVVYGSWWWPSAPPVYWTPPPRYRPPSYQAGFSASISFGVGIGVMNAVYGDARPDWHRRQVMVNQTRITTINNTNNTNIINNNRIVNNNVTINRNVTMNQHPVVWHHDARYGGGGRYAQQAAPAMAQQAARPAAAPAPALPNVQQRIAQEDQARQRQAFDQQRQREQQANDQQRQREQMIRDQQRQHEQQSQDQRQQQQAQERQMQLQTQQRQQQMQQQQQQQQREQQMRQQQMQDQQRQQQMRQQQHDQQQRQQQQVRQQAPQPQQRPQPQRNDHNERNDRNGHRDEHRDERG